jgi:hypothetical protein
MVTGQFDVLWDRVLFVVCLLLLFVAGPCPVCGGRMQAALQELGNKRNF